MSEKKLRIALPVRTLDGYENYVAALRYLGAEVIVRGTPTGCNGLLLPGGCDVAPALYGREPEPMCGKPDPALDKLQMKALDRFVAAKKPVFGICRGLQLINVYFGGTLIQHLPTSAHHSSQYNMRICRGTMRDPAHATCAEKMSFIGEMYGTEPVTNSSHHQAVEETGKGLQVVQWSDDGVVEGFVHTEKRVWAVQWHPERMCLDFARKDTADGLAVIRYFLDKCKE